MPGGLSPCAESGSWLHTTYEKGIFCSLTMQRIFGNRLFWKLEIPF